MNVPDPWRPLTKARRPNLAMALIVETLGGRSGKLSIDMFDKKKKKKTLVRPLT